jgi:hypothetical protein
VAIINVFNSAQLRNAIQIAGSADLVTLQGDASAIYSVHTLARRSSFVPRATPRSGYLVQAVRVNLSSLLNTRIYQQNVDGAFSPGTVRNLILSYTSGGTGDGGALLSVTSADARSIALYNVSFIGSHRGWNGNGNLYMSLRSFNAAAPLNTALTITGVTVNLTGQANSFNGTTGGSAFLQSWNNNGAVRISASTFNEAGYASSFNFLTFGSTAAGNYFLAGNIFRRTSNATVRPEGNRLGSVVANLLSNRFQDGSYLDLYGNVGSVTLNSNTFSTIAGGYGIRVNDPVTGTPTLSGTNVFTGGGLALKFVKATAGTTSLAGAVTVNGSSFSSLLAGGQAADAITGTAANDWISGDTGNDSLTGGSGDDSFVFATALNAATNVDTITDFKASGSGTDKILLASSVFTGLGTGTLSASDFGTAALIGTDVVYDSTTKGLYFAAGGAATLAGYTLFATLGGTSTVTPANTDFTVF